MSGVRVFQGALNLFPSPEGKFIDLNNFRNRAWKGILEKLPDIYYRKLYQTRHPFITLQVRAGVSTTQIAKWVGNSTEIIEKHYLGDISNLAPPEI
jgi:integrase